MSLKQRLYDTSPIWVQNAAVTAYGYHLRRKRYGRGDAVRRQIQECRAWRPSQIAEYQQSQLAGVLDQCFSRVPYYQEVFRAHGLSRQDVPDVAALPRLPLLPKETVRQRGPELIATGTEPYWIQHTSGSTGTPVDVHLNQHTYQLVHGLLADFERQSGVGARDLRATFAGRLTQPVDRMVPPFWRYNHADRQLLFSSYHINDATMPAYMSELTRRQPVELIGYPSAIATVARHIVTHHLEGTIRPRVVITNSETLFDWQRAIIEQAFKCPVRDYYGSAEAVVFAGQCERGLYHVNPLLGLAEIIDESGKAADDGALVCTTLTNTTMPLVRYEVGDRAIREPRPCTCGRSWPAFRQVVGRIDDVIVTPDGRWVGRIDHIFKGLHGIRECQVVQEAVDAITLKIVKDPDFNETELLLANIRERLGSGVRVTLDFVDQIPRTKSGKFRGVISRLDTLH